MLPERPPSDWSECNRLLERLGADELLRVAHAVAETVVPMWRLAAVMAGGHEPVERAANYLGDWLRGACDGTQARLLGDGVYRAVRQSGVPAGDPARSAALAAGHAVFALAFHLGQCRRNGRPRVIGAVQDAIAHGGTAAREQDFASWCGRWLSRVRDAG